MTTDPRSLENPATLRQFVRRLAEGIYITSAKGEILDLNPAALEILGFSSLAEARRVRVTDLLVRPAERLRELDVLAREGVARKYELEVRRPDGQVRTLLDTCYAERDSASGETLFHGTLVDVTDLKRLERELREAAVRDALTGCFNRHYLDEVEERLERHDDPWAALVFDIDHFKRFNDEFGHATGDDVLVRLARFLLRHLRADDPVVRLGGDEFLVLLKGADEAAAAEMVARLEEARSELGEVSFSLGWAARRGGESIYATIDRADRDLLARRERRRGTPPAGRRQRR